MKPNRPRLSKEFTVVLAFLLFYGFILLAVIGTNDARSDKLEGEVEALKLENEILRKTFDNTFEYFRAREVPEVEPEEDKTTPKPIEEPNVTEHVAERASKIAYVTGYNSFPEQTSGDPCIGALGVNLCEWEGDTPVACPRNIKLGSKVLIDGEKFTCLDRTASHYDGRFDIFCHEDIECPYQVTGWKEVVVAS